MGAMKDIEAEAHAIWSELEAAGHSLAGRARSLWERLRNVAVATEAEAKADAKQVLHDAEDVAKPVVAEAEQDVKQVAEDAAHAIIPQPRTPA